jgi:ABC-2 type transport system ATP-binding protein
MTEAVIQVQNLTKNYTSVRALNGISFDVSKGGVFGLLGPNGSGKTTTIRILLNILIPDSGSVRILGKEPAATKRSIGYLPEHRGLYPSLQVLECLTYLGTLKGMNSSSAYARAVQLLEELELSKWGDSKIKELSRGMHQKIQLIASIIHDPEIIIWDEPFQGLDPINIQLIKTMIRKLSAAGKTILLSAHEMSLVERLCDSIVIIYQGEALIQGKVSEIKKKFAPKAIDISPLLDLSTIPHIVQIETFPEHQRAHLAAQSHPRELIKEITARGLPIESFRPAEISLDDIFIRIIQEKQHA